MTDPGVVTPDKNAESELSAAQLAHLVMEDELRGHDALDELVRRAHAYAQTPQAPRPAPGTPQRGSVDGDSSEALRAWLVEWFETHLTYEAFEKMGDDDMAAALLPLFVAYGDQRAAEALREAAADCRAKEDRARERRGDYNDGLANGYDSAADELETRADEIHDGRHAL